MIVRNAAFVFDLLTNKLSKSKALGKIESSKWTNNNSGTGFGAIMDCYNGKKL